MNPVTGFFFRASDSVPYKLLYLKMEEDAERLEEPQRSLVKDIARSDWTLAEGSGGQDRTMRCSFFFTAGFCFRRSVCFSLSTPQILQT